MPVGCCKGMPPTKRRKLPGTMECCPRCLVVRTTVDSNSQGLTWAVCVIKGIKMMQVYNVLRAQSHACAGVKGILEASTPFSCWRTTGLQHVCPLLYSACGFSKAHKPHTSVTCMSGTWRIVEAGLQPTPAACALVLVRFLPPP